MFFRWRDCGRCRLVRFYAKQRIVEAGDGEDQLGHFKPTPWT